MRDEDFENLHHLEDTFWWFVGMRDVQAVLLDPVVDAAGASLRPEGERVILDLGCGTGGNLTWLRRYGKDATIGGLDVVEQALRFCQTRDNRDVVLASATDLPYADECCDIATSFDVLVQLPQDGDDVRALAEMYRVLRPGGVSFVRAAAYMWMHSAHDKALDTHRRYSLRQVTQLARNAGFHVERRTYGNTFLFPIAAVRRVVLMRIGLTSADSDVRPMPRSLQWANSLLTAVVRFEARLLSLRWMRLPFGVSTILVLRKPPLDARSDGS